MSIEKITLNNGNIFEYDLNEAKAKRIRKLARELFRPFTLVRCEDVIEKIKPYKNSVFRDVRGTEKHDTQEKDLINTVRGIFTTDNKITTKQKDFIRVAKGLYRFESESNKSRKKIVGKDVKRSTKCRVGQAVFRQQLLKKYGECNLCKLDEPSLLRASHIKSWKNSKPIEKIDKNNGLLLCPTHDALFDAGYISFDIVGKVMISDKLSKKNQEVIRLDNNMRIRMEKKIEYYMKWHRKNRFKN